MELTVSSFL